MTLSKNYSFQIVISCVFILLLLLVVSGDLAAQCPMCRMSAESNMENGGTAGKGLNNGILYMLSMPYLIIGTIGYLWWKNRRKGSDAEGQEGGA